MMGELSIPLPAGYRVRDVLAFHSRDAEGVAERIAEHGLRKGILLGGVPVLIEIDFHREETESTALCRILPDSALTAAQQAPLLEDLGKPLATLKSWVAGAHYSSEPGMKELGFTGSVFFQTFPACTHPEGHE